jgi:hypothetical protein
MKLIKTLAVSLLCAPSFLALTAITATPAHAQATRTWVSGVGDDVNPCSRTAPCKTFAGAISKTAAGGEINCLDPGGFGAVSIIKSMTIDCHYTEGGALAGGNGIVVNMLATTDVTLIRGLDIFGVNPPSNGIRFINNGSLHVEDTVIRRFNAASSAGISVAPSGATRVYLNNVLVANNGNGATGGGIVVQPGAGSTGSVKLYMTNVRVHENANIGLSLNTTGNTSLLGISAVIDHSSFLGSTFGIQVKTAVGTAPSAAMITNSNVFDNGGVGIQADGASARARVGTSTITGNSTGVSAINGGAIQSYVNNRLDFNGSDGTFSAPNLIEE